MGQLGNSQVKVQNRKVKVLQKFHVIKYFRFHC